IWYGPLFANAWMKEIGKTREQLGQPGPGYALTLVGALVESFVLALVVKGLKVPGVIDGAIIGLVVAVGFVLTTFAAGYIFEGRSLKLYLINVGYHFFALIIMGAILAAIP
ncbi:MAG TPA: DUF1761 domain-containing protein, partial [Anaerolineae bacterium]